MAIGMRGTILAALLAASLPQAVSAGMRCGSELVQEGETKVAVLKKCGTPLLTETIGVKEATDGEVIVERWTYDLGPGRFLQLLTFEGGELVSVENGERQ